MKPIRGKNKQVNNGLREIILEQVSSRMEDISDNTPVQIDNVIETLYEKNEDFLLRCGLVCPLNYVLGLDIQKRKTIAAFLTYVDVERQYT